MDMSSDIRLLKRPKWMADWASRENFQARLFSLVKRHCKSQVVLSYVTDAYPSEIEIRRFFEMTFSNVSV
ncbi:hypothetical protein, partial [Klebsiella aerogenes]|uniref:hypothetical protein n=1 Tax=Klebsiella aerogenes TaxID=548 RepID=UPI001954CEF7